MALCTVSVDLFLSTLSEGEGGSYSSHQLVCCVAKKQRTQSDHIEALSVVIQNSLKQKISVSQKSVQFETVRIKYEMIRKGKY